MKHVVHHFGWNRIIIFWIKSIPTIFIEINFFFDCIMRSNGCIRSMKKKRKWINKRCIQFVQFTCCLFFVANTTCRLVCLELMFMFWKFHTWAMLSVIYLEFGNIFHFWLVNLIHIYIWIRFCVFRHRSNKLLHRSISETNSSIYENFGWILYKL